jgi:hypothetical protein
MSAKCFVTNRDMYHMARGFSPEKALEIASGTLAYGVRDFGNKNPLAVKKKTMKTTERFGVCKSLSALGDIDLRDEHERTTLCVTGARNSILEMFKQADQSILITVGAPPGVFVGVYREEHWLKKDTLILRISSLADTKPTPGGGLGVKDVGIKRGNSYHESFSGKKRWTWHWFTITDELGVGGMGRTTVHPRAFELPLKNIFDQNKWW